MKKKKKKTRLKPFKLSKMLLTIYRIKKQCIVSYFSLLKKKKKDYSLRINIGKFIFSRKKNLTLGA